MTSARVLVGIGGNVGDRLATLRSAVALLREGALAGVTVAATSPIYETHPVGPSTAPFLNAVIELRTSLAPDAMLAGLLEVERAHGRERDREARWGPRTLDLDILVWISQTRDGDRPEVIAMPGLTVPHPRAAQRDFVLAPLADLVGDAPVLAGDSPRERLAALPPDERTVISRLPERL